MIVYGEMENVKVANERDDRGGANVGGIGDPPHDSGKNCAAKNRHDLERRTTLCERAQILDAERKNCREHDGVKKATPHECADGCGTIHQERDDYGSQGAGPKDRENARRRDVFHQRFVSLPKDGMHPNRCRGSGR